MKLITHITLVLRLRLCGTVTSTPLHVFMMWCLMKHRDTLPLPYIAVHESKYRSHLLTKQQHGKCKVHCNICQNRFTVYELKQQNINSHFSCNLIHSFDQRLHFSFVFYIHFTWKSQRKVLQNILLFNKNNVPNILNTFSVKLKLYK